MSEQSEVVTKCDVVPPLSRSKSFSFNWVNMIVIPIVWPFLSKDFRASEYAPAAITAWALLGNAIFRVMTRNRAIKILSQMEAELGQEITIRKEDV